MVRQKQWPWLFVGWACVVWHNSLLRRAFKGYFSILLKVLRNYYFFLWLNVLDFYIFLYASFFNFSTLKYYTVKFLLLLSSSVTGKWSTWKMLEARFHGKAEGEHAPLLIYRCSIAGWSCSTFIWVYIHTGTNRIYFMYRSREEQEVPNGSQNYLFNPEDIWYMLFLNKKQVWSIRNVKITNKYHICSGLIGPTLLCVANLI